MHETLKAIDLGLDRCLAIDRRRLQKRVARLKADRDNKQDDQIRRLQEDLDAAIQSKEAKTARRPEIRFPDALPITARLDEIGATIREHPVTIVCGETGSGKSTQLPKLCVQLGYGLDAMIGHTQPRRIAARSIADRIAVETSMQMGQGVGFKIRHTDRTSAGTWIKVMTDGVLLAEMQRDRWLNAYEVLIIDEAHERSLNIDFLLGYLKLLSSRRPDLKIIVTSATIDVKRFSSHFNDAPVIEVSGRSYPVEIRYQPIENEDEDDEVARGNALLDAVNALGRDSHGDILVFLDGEREIQTLQKFLDKQKLPNTDVLPLYSRLGPRKQARIFQPHKRRHIILSTNVAETSLTIDGIRYVIDFGFARISRYSYKSKVQRLPIEKISRASANQRAGRCGRTADGICIRLYSQEDFEQRPAFTDPEILRTSLASVILQMKLLRLGDIREFDFIDPPNTRYINDGIRLLDELGALDDEQRLTGIGKKMARLPLDPRLARMLIAAAEWNCLNEMLMITSALAIQDLRERPLEAQEKADQAHSKFIHEHSDFLWFSNFWKFYQEHSGKLSRNRLQKLCRQNYVSAVRMLEWQDIHTQLTDITQDMGMKTNTEPAHYNNIHCAILTGLSSHIAQRSDERHYIGARNTHPYLFPGSSQFGKRPRWIMACELVETSRLYARTVAKIDPEWLLKTAAHLLQREYFEPHWQHKKQRVLIREKISLYGLIIVASRSIACEKVDRDTCRQIFIREALVHEGLKSNAAFYKHNHGVMEEVRAMENKSRRLDILDEEAVYEFYDQRLGKEVCNPDTLDHWRKQAEREDRESLFIQAEDIMRHAADSVSEANYPDILPVKHLELPLNYRFRPGEAEDGINIDVPVYALNQLSDHNFDRLVPGLLQEKITCLLKSLPKQLRKSLVPIPDTARECLQAVGNAEGSLIGDLSDYLFRKHGLQIREEDWRTDQLPSHLCMNVRVIDEHGNCISEGRDLAALKASLSERASGHFAVPDQHVLNQTGITDWDFGTLPESIEIEINGITMPAWPALIDNTDSVSISTFDTQSMADAEMVNGLCRLFMLHLAGDVKYMKKHLPHVNEIKLLYSSIGDTERLLDDLLCLVFREVFVTDKLLARDSNAFLNLVEAHRPKLIENGNDIAQLLYEILSKSSRTRCRLDEVTTPSANDTLDDIRKQIGALLFDGFLRQTPVKWLQQFPRYLDAINKRIDSGSYARDRKRMEEVREFESIYRDFMQNTEPTGDRREKLDNFRWMIEEYRVSLFAQELKTSLPVSRKRLEKQVEKIRRD